MSDFKAKLVFDATMNRLRNNNWDFLCANGVPAPVCSFVPSTNGCQTVRVTGWVKIGECSDLEVAINELFRIADSFDVIESPIRYHMYQDGAEVWNYWF